MGKGLIERAASQNWWATGAYELEVMGQWPEKERRPCCFRCCADREKWCAHGLRERIKLWSAKDTTRGF